MASHEHWTFLLVILHAWDAVVREGRRGKEEQGGGRAESSLTHASCSRERVPADVSGGGVREGTGRAVAAGGMQEEGVCLNKAEDANPDAAGDKAEVGVEEVVEASRLAVETVDLKEALQEAQQSLKQQADELHSRMAEFATLSKAEAEARAEAGELRGTLQALQAEPAWSATAARNAAPRPWRWVRGRAPPTGV